MREGRKLLDLGSGSGILAVPLKVLAPGMEVCPVDSSLRKVQFLRHIKRSIGLEGFFPVHGESRRWSPWARDMVTAKAFGPAPLILGLSGRHMAEGGRAFILKGTKEEAAEVEGFALKELIPYTLPGSSKQYRLFVYSKEAGEGESIPEGSLK